MVINVLRWRISRRLSSSVDHRILPPQSGRFDWPLASALWPLLCEHRRNPDGVGSVVRAGADDFELQGSHAGDPDVELLELAGAVQRPRCPKLLSIAPHMKRGLRLHLLS